MASGSDEIGKIRTPLTMTTTITTKVWVVNGLHVHPHAMHTGQSNEIKKRAT